MALSILAINPPYVGNREIFYMPIGLGLVVAIAEREGHRVQVVDALNHHLDFDVIERRMLAERFDLVMMGGFAMQVKAMREITRMVRHVSPDTKVLIGGVGISDIPRVALDYVGADMAATGECEAMLPDLLTAIETETSLSAIPSLAFRDADGGIVVTPKGEVIEDLDQIPWPAYHHFDIDLISRRSYNGEGKRSIHLMTSRGCPFRCDFCINSILNDRGMLRSLYGSVAKERPKATQRFRSTISLVAEINYLRDTYGINDFHFADEEFITNKARVFEVCEALKPLGITWSTSARADWASVDKLAVMREAGCRYLLFGIETGSQEMLDHMVKAAKIQNVSKGLAAARQTGMRFIANFMVGHPGENEKTIRETVEFCRREELVFLPAFVTLFPNSKMFHENAHKIQDWESYFSTLEKINFVHRMLVNLTEMSEAAFVGLRNWGISMTVAYKIVGKDRHALARLLRPFVALALWSLERAPASLRRKVRDVVVNLFSLGRRGDERGVQIAPADLGQQTEPDAYEESLAVLENADHHPVPKVRVGR